jgi:hypothetical protein
MKRMGVFCFRMLVILSVITVGCLLVCVRAAFGYETVLLGHVDVEMYVVALDGVSARGVGNITNMVDGVFRASRVNVSSASVSFTYRYVEVEINTTVTVICDWNTYKDIVETGSDIIIVNGHGETVPVPADYTRNAWVDEIAEAMLNRNVTWVHTGGYPFNYSYMQESGEQGWGEEGFQRLMSHVGKSAVTCYHPYPTIIADITNWARGSVFNDWPVLDSIFRVQKGNPLKSSDFKNCTFLPIWGSEDDYMTGAVIKFAETSSASGFYVHIGTNQTYNSDNVPTDRDYYRGYAGSAAALWACAWHSASKDALSAANESIVKAETEGRTKGLEDARKLLQNAEELLEAIYRNDHGEIGRLSDLYYSLNTNNGFGTVAFRAIEAENLAEKAVQPSFLEANLPLIAAVLIAAGVATAAVIVARHKRNLRR